MYSLKFFLDSLRIISELSRIGVFLIFSSSFKLFSNSLILLHTLSVSFGFSPILSKFGRFFFIFFHSFRFFESRIYSDFVIFVRILCILFKCQILSNCCRILAWILPESVGFYRILSDSSRFFHVLSDILVFTRIL